MFFIRDLITIAGTSGGQEGWVLWYYVRCGGHHNEISGRRFVLGGGTWGTAEGKNFSRRRSLGGYARKGDSRGFVLGGG